MFEAALSRMVAAMRGDCLGHEHRDPVKGRAAPAGSLRPLRGVPPQGMSIKDAYVEALRT